MTRPRSLDRATYRIDDLARAAGTTVRNVRSYQERGLLHPPIREGRIGLYDRGHLARLRMIDALLERGFSQRAIAEIVTGLEEGHDVRDLVGLEDALTSPFSDETPGETTGAELSALFGGSRDMITLVERAGLVVTLGADRFRVPSPEVLEAAAKLHAAGVRPAPLVAALETIRESISLIATTLVDLLVVEVLGPRLAPNDGQAALGDLEETVRALRPLARRATSAELMLALDARTRAAIGEHLPKLANESKKRPPKPRGRRTATM
jgi:DNA-binding transcriptional MerR regulator